MKALMLGMSFLLIGHVCALIFYNRYRVKSIIKHLRLCRAKELSERDFQDLVAVYTGFLGYVEPFPSKKHYSKLYENRAFFEFYSRAKPIIKYLLIAVPVGFALVAIVDGLNKAYG